MCRQWFDEIEPVGSADGVFRVRVRRDVHRRYLENQCGRAFTEAHQAITGRLDPVKFIGPDEHVVPPTNGNANESPTHGVIEAKVRPSAYRPASSKPEPVDALILSPDYTFDQFVVGPENRLAHAAAVAVADQPGRTYNPLFVHGGVGLGKTHLLQAICLTMLDRNPDAPIHYTSCEGFVTQYLESVQGGRVREFRHRFRDVDMLVIDDIQFLAKRESTQEEFFHTFNTLYQSGKQIIISSDAAPDEIPDLESRLVSRFKSGLVVDVGKPNYETRVQIIKRKAQLRGLIFPEEVANYVASRDNQNIRELEGAITRIQMVSITDSRPIDIDLAREALNDQQPEQRAEVSIKEIVEVVTDHFGVKVTDLQGKRRQKSIALPRQVCMYLARRSTRFSLEEIGGFFGGRDHTTVMHAVRTIGARRRETDELHRTLTLLESKLGVDDRSPAG
ncbi:MAG: chromosomal replication initiator protein DnaA [Phycisphaerales bacterium]